MSKTFPPVLIYSSQFCPFCFRAKSIFQQLSVPFEEINVDVGFAKRQEMMQKSGQRTVPQIWIGDRHVGGCDDLIALQQSGELASLLEQTP